MIPITHDNSLDNSNFFTANARQITNFLRGYVDNEINLNRDGSCWNTCPDYEFARNYRCFNGTFCHENIIGEADRVCKGTIIDCSFIDQKMEVCPSVSISLKFVLVSLKTPNLL